HMLQEARILFALCRRLDVTDELPVMHYGSFGKSIEVTIREHEDRGDAASCAGKAIGRNQGLNRDCHSRHIDRGWFPQSESFRRGPGRIHLRDAIRDLRDHLSLFDVAAASADADVLAARMAGVSQSTMDRAESTRTGEALLHRICGQ